MAGLYYGHTDLVNATSDLRPITVRYEAHTYFAEALYSPVHDHWAIRYPWGTETLQDVSRARMMQIMWDEMDLRFGD